MNELEKLEKELLQEIQEEPQIYADTEEFCTIDPKTRIITVPPGKRIIGAESDQETNRLYFKCPKMVGDNVDLSLFSLRINYQNAGNKKDQYLVEDVKEEGDNITFSWLLKRNVTAYKGNVKFILCAVKTTEDGAIKNEWNTTLNTECESLEGMEVDKAAVEEETKDIVEQLIAMMNQSAENAVHAVEEAKAKVDKEVEDFALTAQKVLSDVNDAGQAQTERVQTAGTTAVENIENTQGTATQAVETAKAEAVKTVQTEGTTQTGAVTTEGEKQVQAVRGAAQEIIADREQIQMNKEGVAKLKEDIEQIKSTAYTDIFFKNFFALQRTGKKYTVKFPLWETSQVSTGEKLDDNAGLIIEPSTITEKGRDDYAEIPLFKTYDCNVERINGKLQITAMKGDVNYNAEEKDTFVLGMPYYQKTWVQDGYFYLSRSDVQHEGYILCPEAKKN